MYDRSCDLPSLYEGQSQVVLLQLKTIAERRLSDLDTVLSD